MLLFCILCAATLCGLQNPDAVVFKLTPEMIHVKLNSLNLVSLVWTHKFPISPVTSRWHHASGALDAAVRICPVTGRSPLDTVVLMDSGALQHLQSWCVRLLQEVHRESPASLLRKQEH